MKQAGVKVSADVWYIQTDAYEVGVGEIPKGFFNGADTEGEVFLKNSDADAILERLILKHNHPSQIRECPPTGAFMSVKITKAMSAGGY